MGNADDVLTGLCEPRKYYPHVLRGELPLPPQNKTIEQRLLRAVKTFTYCLPPKVAGHLLLLTPRDKGKETLEM